MSAPGEAGRLFTVEEANAALDGLREALARIRQARREVLRSGRRIRRSAAADGGGGEAGSYLDALTILRTEVEALAEAGIILRDAESGLVDFPSMREGRVVQLCWRLGEDQVAHWHEVDAGFQARKAL